MPELVAALADLLGRLETKLGLAEGALKLEMMVETPQMIIAPGGESNLRRCLMAARGRCVAAHFGTYDYTASCNITAAYQDMMHPACTFAKQMMQVSFAATGIMLSDGATNIMPVAPHKAAKGGALSPAQEEENRRSVHRAWRLHWKHSQHSLSTGYYQGWDLHPAQLPVRYASVYTFFFAGLEEGGTRLKNFVEKAAQATLAGDVFDDAATGQGLLNFFLRAVNCGALTEDEAITRSGVTLDELRSRSFLKILANRRQHR
jgi:malate synthase